MFFQNANYITQSKYYKNYSTLENELKRTEPLKEVKNTVKK